MQFVHLVRHASCMQGGDHSEWRIVRRVRPVILTKGQAESIERPAKPWRHFMLENDHIVMIVSQHKLRP